MIPFVNLIGQRNAYKSELEQAERAVFDSGCYVGGPAVGQLEASLADFCGVGNVIACGSGTEALTVALMAIGIRPGDEVIVPDFTFIAPAECVAALGGTPKFADIDPETLQISPESVNTLVSPATKGIIAVDLFGQCAPFRELREIAKRHGIWILEDAAQAFGASVDQGTSGNRERHGNGYVHADSLPEQRRACTFGDISITSFYPSKPLGCYGDGGAIFTDNDELAAKVKQIANHGSSVHYLHETVGVNSRLDSIQAAILNVKLKHFEEELGKRRENAAKYDAFFAGIGGIKPQRIADGNTSTYAQYTLLVDNRDSFIEKLKAAEIPYCIHYPMALHCQPCFANGAQDTAGKRHDLNCAENTSRKAISLPVCAFTDVDAIIEKLRNVI